MKLPVIDGDKNPSFDARQCPVCGQGGMHEPNSFAFINVGANKPFGEDSMVPADETEAFFTIGWHGAHSDMNGIGSSPDTGGEVEITKDVPGGQFEIYLCSTKCLRKFFNDCVDKLESKIK